MRSLVFGNVHPEGFLGFAEELEQGEWASIDIAPLEGPKQTALAPLCNAPTAVGWKLALKWSIAAAAEARDGAGSAKDLDRAWDGKQKQLSALITAAANDTDPLKSAAAGRLHKLLLRGAGTQQTKLAYQQEVDFGKQQILAAANSEAAADVALLGLGPVIAEIAAATQKLGAAIGHGEGSDRPSERFRAAIAECASVFASVSGRILWIANNGQPGQDRQRAAHLLAPLEALVARYPAAATAPTTPSTPTTPPVTPVPDGGSPPV